MKAVTNEGETKSGIKHITERENGIYLMTEQTHQPQPNKVTGYIPYQNLSRIASEQT